MAISIDITLETNIKNVVRDKLKGLLTHENVVRDTASAVAGVLTDYVPRSDRPPSVHHLQDFEAREDGRIRWYGQGPHGYNYAQKVYFNTQMFNFHVRYPGHDPHERWTEMLYDAGVMSLVQEEAKKALEKAASEINKQGDK